MKLKKIQNANAFKILLNGRFLLNFIIPNSKIITPIVVEGNSITPIGLPPLLLFDLIKSIFTDKEYVRNITYQQASQCFFMVLRRLAINYPEQANVFNRSDVNPKDVINFFSDYLYTGTVPKWVYTSVKDVPKTKTKNKFTESDIKGYLEYYDISRKDYEIANKLFHDELESDIREYVDLMKGNVIESY